MNVCVCASFFLIAGINANRHLSKVTAGSTASRTAGSTAGCAADSAFGSEASCAKDFNAMIVSVPNFDRQVFRTTEQRAAVRAHS